TGRRRGQGGRAQVPRPTDLALRARPRRGPGAAIPGQPFAAACPDRGGLAGRAARERRRGGRRAGVGGQPGGPAGGLPAHGAGGGGGEGPRRGPAAGRAGDETEGGPELAARPAEGGGGDPSGGGGGRAGAAGRTAATCRGKEGLTRSPPCRSRGGDYKGLSRR